MTLVVHPHFHFRRTGTTAHVEAIVPALSRELEARTLGTMLSAELPRISVAEVWRRSRRETVVWHAHRNNELLVGLLLRALGCRMHLVFTRHAATPPTPFTRWLLRRADRIVALTEQVATVVPRASTVIGHGVDVERFGEPASRGAAWEKLGLPGRYGVGVVGRIRPPKGQGDFIRAVAPLLPRHPDWHAVLVGRVKAEDRGWAETLRAAAPAGGLTFVPEQQDVRPYYQALSILVQPSLSEGFSLVLLEALASGCCVVASRLPHFPALVKDGVTGFLYEPGNPAELSGILDRLMGDPSLVARVGQAAAEDARARLGLRHEARALASLYRELL